MFGYLKILTFKKEAKYPLQLKTGTEIPIMLNICLGACFHWFFLALQQISGSVSNNLTRTLLKAKALIFHVNCYLYVN